jgi:hypothetical protein
MTYRALLSLLLLVFTKANLHVELAKVVPGSPHVLFLITATALDSLIP